MKAEAVVWVEAGRLAFRRAQKRYCTGRRPSSPTGLAFHFESFCEQLSKRVEGRSRHGMYCLRCKG
eukprot:scaffold72667_cov18-Tisochrysis_lutea.AAC.3